jgi:hypothetical protein
MYRPPPPIGRSFITNAVGLGTVLGIWAHPDDEAFLSAGLMAAARDVGQRVVCVTATLGEHGTATGNAGQRRGWPGCARTTPAPPWPRWVSPSSTCWASATAPAPSSRPKPPRADQWVDPGLGEALGERDRGVLPGSARPTW